MYDENNQNLLDRLKLYKEESEHYTSASRKLAKKVKKYYKGEQLPEDVITVLEDRGQPVLWENIIKKIINKIMGLKSSTKQEMAVFARRVVDKDGANVFTNILRASHDTSEWWSNKKRADFDFITAGMSVREIKVQPLDEKDIFGNRHYDFDHPHVPIEFCYWDPFFKKPDGSDMRYFQVVKKYARGDLEKLFDKELVNSLNFDEDFVGIGATVGDGASIQRAVVNYAHYWEDGKIKWAIWGEDVLLAKGDSPFDMDRFPYAIRRVFLEDSEDPGEYHGPFKDILPLQDRINFYHLRIANMLGTIKMMFESDATEDAESFMEEMAQDSAIVQVKSGALSGGKIKDIQNNSKAVQMMELINDARKQSEEIIGLNSEILGSAVNRLSGSAIENRQNAGLIGLQLFFDASMEQDKDLAEMQISLIQQYVKAEQVYALMDKHEADNYFVVNEVQKHEGGAVQFNEGEPKRKNSINMGRYSVVLRQIPASRGSIAERQKNWTEQFKTLQTFKPEAIMALYPAMLRDTDSPVADEVQGVLAKLDEQSAQNTQAQEMQMKEMQLQMQKMMAQIADFQGKAKENEAQAQLHLAKAEEIRKGDGDEYVKE